MYIELTDRSGKKVFIQTELVAALIPVIGRDSISKQQVDHGKTEIMFSGGGTMVVALPYDEVLKALNPKP